MLENVSTDLHLRLVTQKRLFLNREAKHLTTSISICKSAFPCEEVSRKRRTFVDVLGRFGEVANVPRKCINIQDRVDAGDLHRTHYD